MDGALQHWRPHRANDGKIPASAAPVLESNYQVEGACCLEKFDARATQYDEA